MITKFLQQNRLGLSLIVAAWAIFFGHVYLAGNIFFLDDLKIIYYPLEHAYAQAQANWSLPLWSNEFGFGQPLLAWGQLGFFTPLHLLLRAFGIHPLILLQISVVGYFLAGICGMYAFLRQRKFEQLASALGAALFVFCGFSIGHLNHVNFYTGTMLLPWLLIAGLAVLHKQTVRRTSILALIAAAIAVSAQPQVVMFVFLAAAGILLGIAVLPPYRTHWKKIVLSVLAAGILGGAMASINILPLIEFLPQTERATPLPRSELVEFSYPPWHAITLLLPYFYGNHDAYWGAKGFQELAAFTGLIPLVFAGIALASWKTHRPERIVGIVFVISAIALALGRYSPLYTYLVEHLYVSSIGVASRFVFFFDIGIVLLAACGVADVIAQDKKRPSIPMLASGILLPAVLFAPFIWRVFHHTVERQQLHALLQQSNIFIWIVLTGIALLVFTYFSRWRFRLHVLVAASIATLVAYSWNYSPSTPVAVAFAASALSDTLQSYNSPDGTPPRLYSRPTLLQSTTSELEHARYSDPISPRFSVFQPIHITKPFDCVSLPLEAAPIATADVTVGLHLDPLKPPVETLTIPSYKIGHGARQQACFTATIPPSQKQIWISLTSLSDSGVAVAFVPQTNTDYQVRFVRTANPNTEQWARSQKPLQALITPQYTSMFDEEAAADARHMQVLDGASSARWIGALSIREYRAFIEFFFANDANPFDGDGRHVIEKYRSILDMVGITHLAQLLPAGAEDKMEAAKFQQVASTDLGNEELRVYENPAAYPKAFLVPGAIWKAAADETRDAMSQPDFDPKAIVYLSGPKPPDTLLEPGHQLGGYTTTITKYEPTRVDVRVTTPQDAYLLLTDSTTPQWQTFLDGQPAPQLVGDSIFKSAYVPAGKHIVSFRYNSPATNLAARLASTSLLFSLAGLLYPIRSSARMHT